IMCYVLVLNPFPVIYDDAPEDVKPEKFRFYGRGNHRTFQCHYIPVSGKESTMDFRPPLEGVDHAGYDELVVFESANILPQIVVHLKTPGPLSPEIQPIPAFIDAPIPSKRKDCSQNHHSSHQHRFIASPAENQFEMNMINVSVGNRGDNDGFDRRWQVDRHRQYDRDDDNDF
ncbi:unnamed protein product, partial [Adineta steineri]